MSSVEHSHINGYRRSLTCKKQEHDEHSVVEFLPCVTMNGYAIRRPSPIRDKQEQSFVTNTGIHSTKSPERKPYKSTAELEQQTDVASSDDDLSSESEELESEYGYEIKADFNCSLEELGDEMEKKVNSWNDYIKAIKSVGTKMLKTQ